MIRFFDPGAMFRVHKDLYMGEIERVLNAGDLILRKDVEGFEELFAKEVGTKYAVGVASGTDALYLTMKVLNIGEGDEVIVPSYTFRATIEAIHHTGARPVLVDLGEDWHKYKTEKTAAVIPVHMEGEVLEWEADDDVLMIEDACQAVTAREVKGIAAAYSFYPAKLLGCFGDGGAIATNDEKLYEELLIARNHYKGVWKKCGFNSRLDNVQAAVLKAKLEHKILSAEIECRKTIADYYDRRLAGIVRIPKKRRVYQDYIVTFSSEKERDAVYSYMQKNGVETMKNGYPFPYAYPKGEKTNDYESRSLRIPCNSTMKFVDVERVAEQLAAAVNAYAQG